MSGLAAGDCNRDMRHPGIRRRAMPVPLSGLDVHDIANGYLALFLAGRDHAPAGCYHQDLVAAMGMPPCGGAFEEVHQVTAEVIGIPLTDDRLPCPAYGSPGPSGNRCGTGHEFFR